MYRSAVGHTVSRDANSHGRVHHWNAAKCETFPSDAFACV